MSVRYIESCTSPWWCLLYHEHLIGKKKQFHVGFHEASLADTRQTEKSSSLGGWQIVPRTVSVCLWKQIPSGCPQWFLYCSAHRGCVNNIFSVAFCCSSSFWRPDPRSSAFLLLSSSLPCMALINTCTLCSGCPQMLGFTFNWLSRLWCALWQHC